MIRRLAMLLLLAGLAAACDEDHDRRRDRDDETPRSPTAPAPVVPAPPVAAPLPVPVPDRIEFRVFGTFPLVLIRHANSIDGLTQLWTGLPYFASFPTIREALFVSLDAAGVGVGFLQVQILVNGQVVREASSSGFYSDPRLSIHLNYRRGQILTALAE